MRPQHRRPLWPYDKLETGWAILYSCFVLLILDFQRQNYVYSGYFRRFVLLISWSCNDSFMFTCFVFFAPLFCCIMTPSICFCLFWNVYIFVNGCFTIYNLFRCPCQEQVCGYVSEQVLPHALNGEHICPSAVVEALMLQGWTWLVSTERAVLEFPHWGLIFSRKTLQYSVLIKSNVSLHKLPWKSCFLLRSITRAQNIDFNQKIEKNDEDPEERWIYDIVFLSEHPSNIIIRFAFRTCRWICCVSESIEQHMVVSHANHVTLFSQCTQSTQGGRFFFSLFQDSESVDFVVGLTDLCRLKKSWIQVAWSQPKKTPNAEAFSHMDRLAAAPRVRKKVTTRSPFHRFID